MSGQQLERSVLERKERDELHAIAEAMALKPGSRTKKADIIDQILRATGVVVDGGTSSEASGSADQLVAPAQPASGDATDGGLNGAAKPRRARTARPRANEGEATGTHSNGAGGAAAPRGAGEADGGADSVSLGSAAGDSAQATTGGSEASAAERRTADRQQSSQARRAAAVAGRRLSPESDGSGAGETGSSNTNGSLDAEGADLELTREASGRAVTERGGRSGPGTGDGSQRVNTQGGPGQDGGQDQAGQGGRSDQDQAGQGGRSDQGSQGSVSQGQGSQGGQNGQGNWSGAAEGSTDGANRRGRRRRGRDRGPSQGQAPERDLQGGSVDSSYSGEPIPVIGLLDLSDKGYGFLRTTGFLSNPRDVYVSVSQVRRFGLRKGDQVEGTSRPPTQSEAYPALVHVNSVGGVSPDEARQRPRFEDLTPLFPDARLKLEVPGDSANMTARIVDLLSPIGKGQRGLIVSPPKAGKTTVLKQIAHSIEANNPDVHLMVLLVDERPEEVTDMRRSVKGEVIASTFDRPADEHTSVAELTIERAKRLVEAGRDVVIVLDGITRLARAYNLAAPTTGRIMSGGVDSGALYPPKKFFGSARNIEEGGSLTILATALVETGSRMDEVIFEEFKGTGNMELRLDRRLAERRIYPAIEVNASSTRHEELLFDRSQLAQVWKLRRVLNALGNDGTAAAGLELLMDKIRTTKSNDEFLAEIAKGPTPGM